ncbi:MAG: helix-turn-helix domain-containing protein [Microbacterium sp.]|uniref:IclR family transcriptional regulator domain-containing protein n=1 Tax=Microbacterium sp. TaxID=51671 RepID=UPI00261D5205|nr:IclR family transcriptional regulator C-terminal domain-containing protein [Microbacterium sp.]MCX6503158.1 helix-turn-helix domain-containing protein [Microbacterium sp.]
MTEDRSRDRIQSIERAVAVLRAFGGHDAALSVSEIAGRVDLPRPVVRRILLTFEHIGYVRAENGRWTLTARILELGAGYFAASSLPEIAQPAMADIVARTGETCSIGELDLPDVIHVARVEERRALQDAVRVGTRLPAHATAVGRVLLAGLPDSELEHYLADFPREAFTPHTLVDAAKLRAHLRLVRERGFDVSVEELHPGMVAAAVPIIVQGRAVAGLTVSSTTVRSGAAELESRIVPVLSHSAARIADAYRAANPGLFRAAG